MFVVSLQLRPQGYVCRDAPDNDCDLPEVCAGDSGSCPIDVYKKNGSPCGIGEIKLERKRQQTLNLTNMIDLFYHRSLRNG